MGATDQIMRVYQECNKGCIKAEFTTKLFQPKDKSNSSTSEKWLVTLADHFFNSFSWNILVNIKPSK